MSVTPNPIDGALVLGTGKLDPVEGHDASGAETYLPVDQPAWPVPLAMTRGRQMSAARRVAR
ncbi:hypothetical protein BH11PSE6_BH11PSE6_00010 [soil metagenome]